MFCWKSLFFYLFFQRSLQVNWFVRHHELFTNLSLRSRFVVNRSKLYFTNHQTTSVPKNGVRKKTWFDFWHFLFCCFLFFFSTIDNYDTWLTALGFHFGLSVLLCKQSGTVRIIVPFNTVTVLFSVAKMMRYWNKAVSVYNVICFAFKKPKIIQKQSPHSPLCCSVCWIISTYFFSMTSFALSAALARYALTSKSTPQACRQNKT